MKRSLDFALVGVVHLAVFALIARLVPVDRFSTMDIYFDCGTRLRAGQVPCRDFALEYPPLAAPLFRLPAWSRDRTGRRADRRAALAPGALLLVPRARPRSPRDEAQHPDGPILAPVELRA